MITEKELQEARRDGVISPGFAKRISEVITEVDFLMKYKSAADEALSYVLETTNDKKAEKMVLESLNIGAHEQPKPQKCPKCGGRLQHGMCLSLDCAEFIP